MIRRCFLLNLYESIRKMNQSVEYLTLPLLFVITRFSGIDFLFLEFVRFCLVVFDVNNDIGGICGAK